MNTVIHVHSRDIWHESVVVQGWLHGQLALPPAFSNHAHVPQKSVCELPSFSNPGHLLPNWELAVFQMEDFVGQYGVLFRQLVSLVTICWWG